MSKSISKGDFMKGLVAIFVLLLLMGEASASNLDWNITSEAKYLNISKITNNVTISIKINTSEHIVSQPLGNGFYVLNLTVPQGITVYPLSANVSKDVNSSETNFSYTVLGQHDFIFNASISLTSSASEKLISGVLINDTIDTPIFLGYISVKAVKNITFIQFDKNEDNVLSKDEIMGAVVYYFKTPSYAFSDIVALCNKYVNKQSVI